MLKKVSKIVLLFLLFSCSKKMQIYCGSGFDNVKTNISISNMRSAPNKEIIVLRDSVLKNNSVTALSFDYDHQFLAKHLKINISVDESRFNASGDSIFYYELNKKSRGLYLDLKLVRKDSTFIFMFRELNQGEKFY